MTDKPPRAALHTLNFTMTYAQRRQHYAVYMAYQRLEAAMDACDYYKNWGGPVFKHLMQCLESESMVLHSVYADDPRYREGIEGVVKRERKSAPPPPWVEGAKGVFTLPFHGIWLNPELNVRSKFDPKRDPEDRELVLSISQNGILVPVIVRRERTKSGKPRGLFELVCGYRRVLAALYCGYPMTIPCVEEDVTEAATDVTS